MADVPDRVRGHERPRRGRRAALPRLHRRVPGRTTPARSAHCASPRPSTSTADGSRRPAPSGRSRPTSSSSRWASPARRPTRSSRSSVCRPRSPGRVDTPCRLHDQRARRLRRRRRGSWAVAHRVGDRRGPCGAAARSTSTSRARRSCRHRSRRPTGRSPSDVGRAPDVGPPPDGGPSPPDAHAPVSMRPPALGRVLVASLRSAQPHSAETQAPSTTTKESIETRKDRFDARTGNVGLRDRQGDHRSGRRRRPPQPQPR